MKKSTQKIIYTVLIMAVLAAVIIYAYFARASKIEEKTPKTKAEKLISRNLEGNYPGTPREVVKLYGEITKCLYNRKEKPKLTKEQFEALFDQVRVLYSQELLEKNERKEQLDKLDADVAAYEKESKTIMSYTVQQSSQIEFGELNGKEVARVVIIFTTKASGEQPMKTYEQFLLQADETDRWKILGWEQISGQGIDVE